MKRHKNQVPATNEGGLLTEDEFSALAEAIAEDKKSSASSAHEPFEVYVHHMHSKMYQDINFFCSRLTKGYQTLLKEIKSEVSEKPSNGG